MLRNLSGLLRPQTQTSASGLLPSLSYLEDSKKISLQKDNTVTQKFKNQSHIKECVHWKALLPSLFLSIPPIALSGVGKLSVKAQVINILGLHCCNYSILPLQCKSNHRQYRTNGMAVFQQNFIYKNRHQVCWL